MNAPVQGPGQDAWTELARAAEERQRSAGDAWVGGVVGRVRRGRRVRAAGMAGATLAVVAAAAVGVSALGGSWRPAPPPATRTTQAPSPSTSPAPTSPAPSSTAPSPAPSQAGVVPGWTAEDLPALGSAVVVDAVEWRGSVVVAGCDAAATTSGDAVDLPVWVGSGTSWQRAAAPAGAPPVTCLDAVAATSDGLVAVAGQRVVRSDDGLTWTSVSLPDEGQAWYAAVVAVGDRMTVLARRPVSEETSVATLWTSTDTRTWQRVGSGPWPRTTAGGEDPAATFDPADVLAATHLGPLAVLVGASPGGQLVPTAAAWTSADGLTWQPATVGSGEGCTMSDVVPWRDGLVAAGWCQATGGPALWTSTDGATWTRVAAPDPLGPPSTGWTEVLAVAPVGDELVLAGADHGDGVEGASAVQWRGSPETGWARADDLVAPYHQTGATGFWPAVDGVAGAGGADGARPAVLTRGG